MRAPRNVIIPFRRDRKSDFAASSGSELLASKVRQVLLTDGDTPSAGGELPWRTAFGAGLDLLRHRQNDAVLEELARLRVTDALARWLPAVRLVHLSARRAGAELRLDVSVADADARAVVEIPLRAS